jgi:Zn finger protein HypA/HybF involved in hydrogenase expression
MATKLPIAQARLFGGVFVCKDCSHKIRSQAVRIISGKIKCPKCGHHKFRAVKKK